MKADPAASLPARAGGACVCAGRTEVCAGTRSCLFSAFTDSGELVHIAFFIFQKIEKAEGTKKPGSGTRQLPVHGPGIEPGPQREFQHCTMSHARRSPPASLGRDGADCAAAAARAQTASAAAVGRLAQGCLDMQVRRGRQKGTAAP